MKKHLYLLLPLLTLHPTLATQKVVNSLVIASTLVLSHKRYNQTLSLDLHKAVEQNNITNALQLINNPQVDINAKVDYGTREWEKGLTPLMYCSSKGNQWLHIAKTLLTHKDTNVNLQDKDGWTPLIWCCWKGDDALDIAQALLKHKNINVNLQKNDGWTPLIMCSWKGDDALQIAQALLKHKNINVNLQQNDGCPPLILCCQEGQKSLQIAQELLKHKNINVNLQQKDGWTPLIRCCKTGDDALEIAHALLKHQHINVNLQQKDGFTPLIMCAYSGDKSLRIVQALLKHKDININLQQKDGFTPLIMCAYSGDKSLHIAHDLLGHQHINVNLQQKDGCTPLLYCADNGDKSLHIAQALLKRKDINVNLQDNDGYTPLIRCCQEGKKSLHLARSLLKHKYINVNLQTNNGWTPLIMCAWKGDDALPIAQALLGHKNINVNLQKNDGKTPLIACATTGDGALHIAHALLGHKRINVNLQNNAGETPLDNIIYWIKNNRKNYKYVNLWNILVAQGGILDKCKADYKNLKPSDFKKPHKGYVQAIKNNPPKNLSSKKHHTPPQNNLNKNNPPINIRFPRIYQKHNQLRKQLEKLQKTSTQQLDHKNNTINKLKDQTQRLTNQLATANQLKDKQQQTIQQQNETINNQKNIIQHKEDQIQYFINQLNTTKQPLQHQIPQGFLSQKYTMQNPLVALLTISDYATSPSKIPNLPLVIKDEEILQNIFQKKYHYTTLTPCKKLNYAVNRKNFDKALRKIRIKIENNYDDEKDKYDGLILVYNGHGELGTALLSDGKKYLMTKICTKFDNKSLDFWIGKPRIIIKLACRGSDKGQSISKNPTPRLQKQTIWHCEDQDFINIYANTEGKIVQQSIDTKNNKGSAFAEAFNELTNFDITFQKDLDQILKMLGNKVRKIMKGTACLEWKTTFFDTLYLTKNTHLNKNKINTKFMHHEEETKEDE